MSKGHFTSLKQAMQGPDQVKSLRLKGVDPTIFFQHIHQFIKLEKLEIINCHLKSVPDEISHLFCLEHLSLSSNHLTHMPIGLFRPPRLVHLCLKNNQIESWSSDFDGGGPNYFAPLEVLDLNDNALTDLPPWLGEITTLKTLGLSGNRLESLPLELKNLKNLTRLNLDNNNLQVCPPVLLEFKNLLHLSLDGNPFSPEEKEKISKLLAIWF